jgi:hypothetical protein
MNDPINHSDPTGLCAEDECGDDDPGGAEDGGMQVENGGGGLSFTDGDITGYDANGNPIIGTPQNSTSATVNGSSPSWLDFLFAGVNTPLTGQPPNSFYIDPQEMGPAMRFFGPDGNFLVDVHYHPNHLPMGDPHLHLPEGPGMGGPVKPISAPPRPVVPPNTTPGAPYSPWPRESPQIPVPLGPGVIGPMLPIIINPCLLSQTFYSRVCGPGRVT